MDCCYIMALFLVLPQVSVVSGQLSVNRSAGGDIVSSCGNVTVCETDTTALLDEWNVTCLNDSNIRQHFQSEPLEVQCYSYLVPNVSGVHSTDNIAVVIREGRLWAVHNQSYHVAILFQSGTRQSPDSNCSVMSLEVIRGVAGGSYRISHSGISVNETIQVDVNKLDYDIESFYGEIYRLRINCGAEDCLYFKLSGQTSLDTAKFNGTVFPTDNCLITTHISTNPFTPSPSTTTQSSTTTTESSSGIFGGDVILQYIVIGAGCGIGLLVFLIFIFCAGICYLSYKSKRYAQSVINIRSMELQAAQGEDEDHYQLNNPAYTVRDSETAVATPAEPATQQQEDHTYALVDDAQAEAEEVRQKEQTAAKFQYTTVTFNTFKPSENRTPPIYQPELDEEKREERLPSFARNYNPMANRAELARSYEIVSPITIPQQNLYPGEMEKEEYDKLVHQERKMTVVSQRKFSISTNACKTDYAQLNLQSQPVATLHENQETSKLPITKRFLSKNEESLVKIPSYSTVYKPEAPLLPPRYEEEEDYYKVPVGQRSIQDNTNHYDHPTSLLKVAWSCDNLQMKSQFQQDTKRRVERVIFDDHYDTPSSMIRSQSSLLPDEPTYPLSINSLSQESYVDMTSSQASYV